MSTSNRLRGAAKSTASRLVAAYRRTGADLPFGDPLPSHGSEMEGWFWRVTDAASGRVVVALCGVNRHAAGDWATVAVALHPGGIVRAAALDGARADQTRFALRAGTAPEARIEASADRLHVDLDDVHLDLRFTEPYVWPKAFGGGGVFSAVPFLNQYWHPYRLGGTANGAEWLVTKHRELVEAENTEAKRQELIQEYRETFYTPYVAAGYRLVDDIIEPAQTRGYLAEALDALSTKRDWRPQKKHGLIPL